MEYVFLITFLGIAFFEVKRSRIMVNPLTIFLIEWCVILFCSKMHWYGLETAKFSTYITFVIGIIFYIIGYYFQHILSNQCKIKKTFKKENFVIRYNLLVVLGIICLIYYLFYLISVSSSLNSFNLWAVQQYLRHNEQVVDNQWIRAIGSFIIGPVSFALPMIGAGDIWFG